MELPAGASIGGVDIDASYKFALGFFLIKLGVVELAWKKHSITLAQAMSNNAPQPKPHWIPMAVVSLTKDYIEPVFITSKKRSR